MCLSYLPLGVPNWVASTATNQTSHLLIHPLHLQWSKYKDLLLERVPSNLTIVLSFLKTLSYIHENMMLPKSDVFVTLRNDGPIMDERDKYWSINMHGDGSKH
jgi:hypothetical protein